MLLMAVPASAGSGGTTAGGGGGGGGHRTVKGDKAKLVKGRAVAPESAPRRVKQVIAAANEIRKKPYKYGGGHGSFKDSGYDCSGSVSYALHGGNLLRHPLDSTGLAHWKSRGKGHWITVFGAPSHAYMIVAGLRFDTSMTHGDGPSWSTKMRSTPENYRKRHAGSL
jgi:hypothetical protein